MEPQRVQAQVEVLEVAVAAVGVPQVCGGYYCFLESCLSGQKLRLTFSLDNRIIF